MLAETITGLGIAIVAIAQHHARTAHIPPLLQAHINSYANGNPPSRNEQEQVRLLEDGVSCLAFIPQHSTAAENIRSAVAIGTKQGRVIIGNFTNDNDSIPRLQRPLDSWTVSKYPVYCLDCCSKGRSIRVYAGCGDRYLSAWTLDDSEPHLLGPHTGWVKAVVQQPSRAESRRLFSVGCNRIEGWEQKTTIWNKVGTIAIESSTEGTCTLSSDLLCLVSTVHDVLVAGGVDGRLHLFREDADPSRKMPRQLATVSAHQGRINALCFEPTTGLLFSASHDKTIACWRLDGDGTIAKEATIPIPSARALCCTCWHRKSKVFVASGTNDGSVVIHSAVFPDGEHPLHFEVQSRLDIPGHSGAVNAVLCLQRKDSEMFLMVGHSKGLHAFRLKLGSSKNK